MSVLEPFNQSIRYQMGKGDRVRFWLDTWTGDSPLATQFPNLFRYAQNGRALVGEYVERVRGMTRWGPTFRRNLLVVEERKFCSLLSLIDQVYFSMDGGDYRIWPYSTNGSFSVASFYDAFNRDDSNASPISSLWKIKAPPRVLTFAWIALQGGNLTIDKLQRQNMVIFNTSPMCLKDVESMDHLFLNCRVTQGLWNSVYSWFAMSGVLPAHFTQLFEAWKLGMGSRRGRIMWKTSFLATIWVIWKERNNPCFKDRTLARDFPRDKVKYLIASWASPLPSFQGLFVDIILRNWKEVAFSSPASFYSVQRWIPPPPQGFKLNFDGSAIGNPSLARGGIIRNYLGSPCSLFLRACWGVLSQ